MPYSHGLRALVGSFLLLALAACGDPSKEDILSKAEGVSTKQELRERLGDPDDIAKVGPLERWIYHANNGEVVFLITGDNVALTTAGPTAEE